jgi:glycosyltransferase involved in cell wall biosynthesis
LRRVDLSIALTRYNEINARRLQPKQVRVVNNGIPDPCPDFATTVLPRRAARVAARRALLAGQPAGAAPAPEAGDDPQVVHVLFLAQCTREKGVFDTLAGAALAQAKLRAAGSPLTLSLVISGEFVTAAERAEFLEQLARAKQHLPVEVLGFVSGEQKRQVLARADVFCFPTYYRNENQPLNLLEALAFGLPIVTTRWRSVHEALPPGALGVVDPQQPAQIAEALLAALSEDSAAASRAQFLQHFTVERHLEELARAIRSVAVPG